MIMANWDNIKTTVGRAANKTVKKAGEIADSASLHFKYKTCKAKVAEKFEKLGRLTYKQLKTELSYAEEIAEVVAELDTLREEMRDIKKKIDEAKKEKEAAKAARKAEKEAEAAESAEETEEETDEAAE